MGRAWAVHLKLTTVAGLAIMLAGYVVRDFRWLHALLPYSEGMCILGVIVALIGLRGIRRKKRVSEGALQ